MTPEWITTGAASFIAALIALDKWLNHRATSNGHRPCTVAESRAMEARVVAAVASNRSAIDGHAASVAAHIKENHNEHADLHDRVTKVQTRLAEIKGEMSARH